MADLLKDRMLAGQKQFISTGQTSLVQCQSKEQTEQNNNIYSFNVEHKQIVIEKIKKTCTQLIKFDHTQVDMYIALTEKGHLGNLQIPTMQCCFVSTMDYWKNKIKITNLGNVS